MQENPALAVVCLPSPDNQLVVFLGDLQVVHRKPGNSERDAKPGRAYLLDVVRRISVGRRLRRTLKHLLKVIETQEKRRGKHTGRHGPLQRAKRTPEPSRGIPAPEHLGTHTPTCKGDYTIPAARHLADVDWRRPHR